MTVEELCEALAIFPADCEVVVLSTDGVARPREVISFRMSTLDRRVAIWTDSDTRE